jgi:branched-subunit amino acid ABC-type transport system permease component
MVQFFFDILIRASDLVLVAVALSAVFSLIKFPNVALAQYAALGAFVAFWFQKLGMPLWLAAPFSCVLTGIFALFLNVAVFEKLLRGGSAFALIGSLAVSMLISAALLVTAGPASRRYDLPIRPPFDLLGVRLTDNQVICICASVLGGAVFALLLHRTDLGRCMRAVATNSVLARATGVSAAATTNTVVFLSGVLACIGGIGLGLKGEINILMGNDILLPIFAAAVLGGLGNPLGAIAGALVIAAAETVATNVNFGFLFSRPMVMMPAAYATAVSFAVLLATLLWRPRGLFVSEVRRV